MMKLTSCKKVSLGKPMANDQSVGLFYFIWLSDVVSLETLSPNIRRLNPMWVKAKCNPQEKYLVGSGSLTPANFF